MRGEPSLFRMRIGSPLGMPWSSFMLVVASFLG